MGLSGGVNTYTYSKGNPIASYDPSGLVHWTGGFSSIAYARPLGIFFDYYDLKSECICGRQALVRVVAGGAAGGIGPGFFGWAVTAGNAEFDDNRACPDANVFDGVYYKGGAGIGLGFGIAYTAVQAGGARGDISINSLIYNLPWPGYQNGIVVDASLLNGGIGWSTAIPLGSHCC